MVDGGKDTGTGTNAEQVAYWNEQGGPKWVANQALLDLQLDALGEMGMEAAGIATGQAVLDIGCGCGSTTLELARRVGASGRAVGIDISRPMLELARWRASDQGLDNAEFLEADAQVAALGGPFDAVFSRFGVMFFEDPVAAFANIRQAMKPGGALAFLSWQAMHRNPWMTVPMMAAMAHISLETPSSPDAPGPVAFADETRVQGILEEAGFSSVASDARDVELSVAGGASLEDTVDFLLSLGPVARILPSVTPDVRKTIRKAVRGAIETHYGPKGLVMPGAVWVVAARA